MANLNNTTLEQFGKTLEDILNRIQYSTRQTRDGSDLSTDGVERAIKEAMSETNDKLLKTLERLQSKQRENAERLREINASKGTTYRQKKNNYRKDLVDKYKKEQEEAALGAGMGKRMAKKFAKERAKEYDDILKKDIEEISESFKEYPKILNKAIDESKKTFTKIEGKIRKETRSQQLNALTFGFHGRARQNIDRLATYGNALNGFGGGLGNKGKAMSRLAAMKGGAGGGGIAAKAMGGLGGGLAKLGGVVKMVGGLFTKLAPAIGWVVSGLQLFGDALNAVNEYEIKMLGFDKERYQANLDFRKQNLDLSNQAKIEQINYEYELIQRNFDVESEIAKAAKSLSADNYAKAVEISLGSITQGISQTAFSAASAAIEAGTTAMTNLNTAAVEREKAAASNEARTVKNENTLENITQELVSTNIAYENAKSEIAQKAQHTKEQHYIVSNVQDTSGGVLLNGDKLMMVGSKSEDNYGVSASENRYNNQEAKSVGNAIGDAAVNGIKSLTGAQGSTHELLEKNLEYFNSVRSGEQDVNKLKIKNENEQANLEIEHETNLYNKKRDYDKSVYDIEVEKAKKVAQEYLKLTQKEFDVFGTLDETMRKSAIGVGILNEKGIERYVETMTRRMPDMMRKWGVTFEEIANVQNAYTNATGRSINLSNADFEKSFGLTMLTGDQGTTDELNADMQKFSMSVADSSDMFGEILDSARQLGLSTRKTGKDLVRDMKLANKYEFKGAKKALAEMSVWANKVRFDMSELPSVIEKQTGSFEDVISNAASIQVLGGNFANYMGDPLKNAFLGFQDPAELAKNVNSALKGIGFFNSRTGKTEISTTDQIRMKAFSEATGISMENLRNQVFQMVQGNKVESALTPKNRENYTKKQIELLQQQAHFSDGEWKVTLANGDEKSINKLTETDFSDLMPHEEAMYDLTKKGVECLEELVGKGRKASGETSSQQIELFQEHTQQFYKTYDDMVIAAREYFEGHKSQFQTELDNNLKIVRESYQGYLQVSNEGNEGIDAKVKQIQGSASAIASTLESVSQLFADAKTKLEGELNNGKKENVREKANATATRVQLDGGKQTAEFNQEYDTIDKLLNTNMLQWGSVASDKVNDGIIAKNGNVIKINDKDQILAAQEGGPVADIFQSVSPRPMPYDSYVKENPYAINSNNGGKIEVAPIEIRLNGNIQISGGNGTIDITQQIANDPNFIRELSQMISKELERKINGGRVSNAL